MFLFGGLGTKVDWQRKRFSLVDLVDTPTAIKATSGERVDLVAIEDQWIRQLTKPMRQLAKPPHKKREKTSWRRHYFCVHPFFFA